MGDMKLAIQVLDKLDHRIISSPDYSIYPYINGRERGFAIVSESDGFIFEEKNVVVFSEHRNTDAVQVMSGSVKHFKRTDFNNFGAGNENMYKRTQYFDTVEAAAEYIRRKLLL